MNNLHQSAETIALLKTSTSVQSKQPNKNADSGEDALLSFMLTSNYVSGMILNNRLLKQHRGIEYVKENIHRSVCFWYPHMFWELLLCQYGKVQSTDLILLNEGLAEKTECDEVELANGEIIIPYYATIEGRLEQHESFAAIFNDLERCKESFVLFREMYFKLCVKTLFLVTMSINVFYRKTDVDPFELLDRAYNYCTREEFFLIHSKSDLSNYLKDVNAINKYYEYNKIQIRT